MMAIKYKVKEQKNGINSTVVEVDSEVDYRYLCDYIGRRSTLKLDRSHVEHVLSRAVDCIVELVSENNSVKVDGLGKFQPRVNVRKDRVDVSVLFTPSVNGFLRRIKREKVVELQDDWDPFPQGFPITTEESLRRKNLLNKIDED